jgi:hypothetical protein
MKKSGSKYILLAILLGVSLSTLAADKIKKSVSKTQQTKTKWVQEPSSFQGVKFNEPITNSVSDDCPKSISASGAIAEEYADLEKIKTFPEGVFCYLVTPHFPSGVSANMRVFPQKSSLLSEPYITTHLKDRNGKVQQIISGFNTSDFSQVKDMLIAKYGNPHKESVTKITTLGGREFDSNNMDWEGKKVSIHVESLVTRKMLSASQLVEYGYVWVRTNEFIKENADATNRAAQEEASKL